MILEPETLNAYRQQLTEAIENQELERANELSAYISDSRIAKILKDADPECVLPFLKRISDDKAGTIISMLPTEMAAEVLAEIDTATAAQFLDDIPLDSAVDIINALEEEKAKELLDQLSPKLQNAINKLRDYAPESVGAYMHTLFIGIKKNATIGDTLQAIHDAPTHIENRSYVFVVDDHNKLEGVVSIKDLVRAHSDQHIKTIMNTSIVAIHADDNAIESAQLLRDRRFQMLPVINNQNRIVGVFLLDEAIKLLSENIVDQFVKIGAASEDESFYTPPFSTVKKRLPWMTANIFLNLGAVAVISFYETTIEAVAALAAFLPMITDMGGNVGIQALSVSIRSIALGEVRLTEYWRATRKELLVGLMNGLALGALFTVIAILLQGNPILGLVAGIALGFNVLVAGIVGGTLPFLIKRLGYDPAMITGPVLTTVTDITGVSIYLGLSTLFLASILG